MMMATTLSMDEMMAEITTGDGMAGSPMSIDLKLTDLNGKWSRAHYLQDYGYTRLRGHSR